MIVRIAVDLLPLSQIVLDVFFEMGELSVGNKHVGVRYPTFGRNAQNFDLFSRIPRKLAAKTLEGQGHVLHPYKLNLETQPAFKILLSLGFGHLLRNGL